MAVTNVQVLHDGWTSSGDDKGKVEFSVTFVVEVDDRFDGPSVVAGAVNPDDPDLRIPSLGDFYNIGNDVDLNAFCKKISPRPVGGMIWHVNVSYGPDSDTDEKGDNEPRDENDQPVQNWEDEAATIGFQLIRTSRAAWQGVYKGQLIKKRNQFAAFHQITWPEGPPFQPFANPMLDPTHFGLENGVAITNSANAVFDPPVEKDYMQIGVTVTRNHRVFPFEHIINYVNSVNSAQLVVYHRNATVTVEPGVGKMMSITGDWRLSNGFPFWRVSYEFHLDHFFGWQSDILDRGLHRSNDVDEDGNSNSEASFKKNAAPVDAIKDLQGHPITEPVKLNGQGQPLKQGILHHEAVFLRYMLYPELDWAALDLNRKLPIL